MTRGPNAVLAAGLATLAFARDHAERAVCRSRRDTRAYYLRGARAVLREARLEIADGVEPREVARTILFAAQLSRLAPSVTETVIAIQTFQARGRRTA